MNLKKGNSKLHLHGALIFDAENGIPFKKKQQSVYPRSDSDGNGDGDGRDPVASHTRDIFSCRVGSEIEVGEVGYMQAVGSVVTTGEVLLALVNWLSASGSLPVLASPEVSCLGMHSLPLHSVLLDVST